MRRSLSFVSCLLAAGAVMFYADRAEAGIEACGDIHVEAEANCEVKTACEAECAPLSFHAACAAECSGECSASASVQCTETDCFNIILPDCEAEPAQFDCRASCDADCGARCSANCEAGDNSAECQGECSAVCNAECSAQCDFEPGSLTCEQQAIRVCGASCKMEANFQCQIGCQGGCEAQMQGGCEIECSGDGALFCNGQYVDHGGNLEECIDSLKALLNIEVTGYARCDGNSCEAGGTISCGSSVNPDAAGGAAGLLGLFLGGGFLLRRRRR